MRRERNSSCHSDDLQMKRHRPDSGMMGPNINNNNLDIINHMPQITATDFSTNIKHINNISPHIKDSDRMDVKTPNGKTCKPFRMTHKLNPETFPQETTTTRSAQTTTFQTATITTWKTRSTWLRTETEAAAWDHRPTRKAWRLPHRRDPRTTWKPNPWNLSATASTRITITAMTRSLKCTQTMEMTWKARWGKSRQSGAQSDLDLSTASDYASDDLRHCVRRDDFALIGWNIILVHRTKTTWTAAYITTTRHRSLCRPAISFFHLPAPSTSRWPPLPLTRKL